MYKLWCFAKRNAARLDLDAYRAGHVGHHASMLRRLKGLRGYCIDLRGEAGLDHRLGALHREISFGAPADFDALWDGLSTLYFDSGEAAARAAEPEPTRATAEGLSVDADWPGNDGAHLFGSNAGRNGISDHWPVDEHVLLPVARPERKQIKLLQFFRRHPAQPQATFRSAVLDRYARLTARISALEGYTVNFKRADETPATDFHARWDGVCELHLDSLEAFAATRADLDLHPELCALERHLFEALWYAEVDENVVVMPNRDPAPDFYYR
jgi:hypothetical protein